MTSRQYRRFLAGSFLSTLLVAAPISARAGEAKVRLDLPAGSLDAALKGLAAEAHNQILYSTTLVAGRRASALHGLYTPAQALALLLAGADVQVDRPQPGVVILKAPAPVGAKGRPSDSVAQPLTPVASDHDLSSSNGRENAGAIAPPPQIADVVVTGTHIRGGGLSPSPLVTITQDDMTREGDATVADALTKLPQNFNGTASPVRSLNGSDRTGTNLTFAQGVDLRGLGANATLVLIDGRRLAGTGNFADFADISALPSAAIDHVEVLLDGASAIYGSDAVGGVVNVITKKNYDGADSSIRIGDDQGGGGFNIQATQALGMSWPGGHALFTYEYQHANRLSASSRAYNANSDLRPLGGTDHDPFESSPGNILGLNAAGTGYVPIYAIPDGNGLGLTPASFVAGTANAQNYYHNTDISPETDRSGLFLQASQALDANTTLDVEGRYNIRHYLARSIASETIFEVTPNNPYYVSPNGAPYELIGYSLDQAAGPQISSGKSQSYDLSVGLSRDLWRDWRLDAYVGMAGEVGRAFTRNAVNSGNLNEALGNTPDDPTTAFSTAVDGFYNPYGSGAANSKTLRAFISDGYQTSSNISLINVASIQVDGTLWTLPGGPIKAAFGSQFRHEHFEPSTVTMTTGTTPDVEDGVLFTRDVSALYGELSLPIIGAANALPGVRSLDLSVAGRVEHYDDVGTTANPKVGLRWRPTDDIVVKATYGTSFRAPALSELNEPTLYAPVNLSSGGKTTLVLLQYGGNGALKPETATTWTAGIEWRPLYLKGLTLGATWFDIRFSNEISDPGVQNLSTVLSDPGLASLVHRLDPSNPTDLTAISAALTQAAGSSATLFPPTAYGAIVDARYLNSASKAVSGLDFTGRYSFAWGPNQLGLNASGTYLTEFSQIQVAGGPRQSLLDTPNNPVNLRARTALDWSRGPYKAAFIVNYVNAYKDPIGHREIDPWTTCDVSLGWRAPKTRGPLQGVEITASVQNLLGSDPPFYDNAQAIGYDPANANPFGRMVALQLNKHW